ncbi:hypothetical protein D3C85_1751470 [compost metagenome]
MKIAQRVQSRLVHDGVQNIDERLIDSPVQVFVVLGEVSDHHSVLNRPDVALESEL